jgi:hypothetical protein
MEESIIKIMSEAGMGIATIIALVVVVIYQLKIMAKMAENIKENTAVLRELKQVVKDNINGK